MKTPVNRSAIAIATALALATALATVALTGCTGGGSTGGSGGGSGGGPGGVSSNPPAPSRLYTDADLVKILTTANTTLNAHGRVTDLGPISTQKPIVSIFGHVKQLGGTMSPAACGPLFDKVTDDLLTLNHADSAFSAKLVYGTTVIGATSTPKGFDVKAFSKVIGDDIDALASTCSSMTLTEKLGGRTIEYNISFTKENATTDAGFTDSYSEVTTAGATKIHTIEIVGLDGNLLIGFAGINSATTIEQAGTAINAVVAAAK